MTPSGWILFDSESSSTGYKVAVKQENILSIEGMGETTTIHFRIGVGPGTNCIILPTRIENVLSAMERSQNV